MGEIIRMIIFTLLILQYILSVIIIYGIFNAEFYDLFEMTYDSRRDRGAAIILASIYGLFSIMGVIFTLLWTRFAKGGFKL